MSKFKVGDRVRIVKSDLPSRVGAAATIIGSCSTGVRWNMDGSHREGFRWRLDVDGVGRTGQTGKPIAYFYDELERIDDRPELTTWEAVHEVCRWLPGTVRA